MGESKSLKIGANGSPIEAVKNIKKNKLRYFVIIFFLRWCKGRERGERYIFFFLLGKPSGQGRRGGEEKWFLIK